MLFFRQGTSDSHGPATRSGQVSFMLCFSVAVAVPLVLSSHRLKNFFGHFTNLSFVVNVSRIWRDLWTLQPSVLGHKMYVQELDKMMFVMHRQSL